MYWPSIAIMFVSVLAFIAYLIWIYVQYKGVDAAIKAEIVKLRQEVNSLNMAQGMKARVNPFGPPGSL